MSIYQYMKIDITRKKISAAHFELKSDVHMKTLVPDAVIQVRDKQSHITVHRGM